MVLHPDEFNQQEIVQNLVYKEIHLFVVQILFCVFDVEDIVSKVNELTDIRETVK